MSKYDRFQGSNDDDCRYDDMSVDEIKAEARADALREADGQWAAALLVDSSLASNISERLHKRVLEMRAAAAPAQGARSGE